MGRRKLTEPSERDRRLLAAFAAGVKIHGLVSEFGITHQRIYEIVRRYEAARPVRQPKLRLARSKPDPKADPRFDELPISGDECSEWPGAHTSMGYGWVGRRYAHRLAWERAHGPIPEGLWILHRCDNPPCVRLDHLFVGTPADNVHDSMAKGRRPSRRLCTETA